jgi:hypothetical protein
MGNQGKFDRSYSRADSATLALFDLADCRLAYARQPSEVDLRHSSLQSNTLDLREVNHMESNTTNYSITQFDGTYSNTNRILKAVNERINSERLSAKRQELGWTQEELAKQAGVAAKIFCEPCWVRGCCTARIKANKRRKFVLISASIGTEPCWCSIAHTRSPR